MSATKILIADDHIMLRKGLRTLLEESSYSVVGEAQNGEEACLLYERFRPDLMILDLDMPGISGLDTLSRILHRNERARILILSMHDDCVFASRALQAGARGFVTKMDPPDVILDAIQKIMKGGRFINNEVALNLSMFNLENGENPTKKLSPREFEVFKRIAEGETLSAIAEQMHIGYKTVANIQTSVRQKLGVETTGQLVHIATRYGAIKTVELLQNDDTS